MQRAFFLVLALSVTAGVSAEERFRWRGRVDGVDDILVRGHDVEIDHLKWKPIQEQDYRFTAPLPRWDVEVELQTIKGRGRVRLMEQPSARNDYTAVVRIEDERSGDAEYEFELRWRDDWEDGDAAYDAFRWEGRVDVGPES